jgi:hypothetical protein
MVLCTDHCSRQNTTKRVFSTVKTRIRVFSPTSFIREKGSSDKALRVSSRLRRSSSLHEYSRLNSKRSISGFFFSFFLGYLLAFTIGPLVVHSWVRVHTRGFTRGSTRRGNWSVKMSERWLVTMSGSWYGTYTPLYKMRYCRAPYPHD